MARGEEKHTIGTKIEDKIQGSIFFTGFGVGGATGFQLTRLSGETSITTPEGAMVTTGAIASIVGGAIAGEKIASSFDGGLAHKIDALKPASMQDGELYLDDRDPFELGISNQDFRRLSDNKIEQVRDHAESKNPNKFDLYKMEEDLDEVDEWVDDMVYGEINGFDSEFKTNINYRGDFKTGYVDRTSEIFVQAPRKGDTFEEAMNRVQTWKENKESLDKADQYLSSVLSKEGCEIHSAGIVDVEIDYDFLQKHEETLRDEVQEGIMTPSENYDIVVTSHNGEPLPVLVGEFNSDMVERGSELYDLENSTDIVERKKVLGMYMDALIAEGAFEGHLGDFWYTESSQYGREGTKNMFYDPIKDEVGVTDIGEYVGEEPDEMPNVSVEERYA